MLRARYIAANLLGQITSGSHTLDQLLDRATPRIQRLNRADRALLHTIVYGVLRWQARLDWVIDHIASRPGKKIDSLVRVILRMGLFQMYHLDRIPTSAAVNTSVELSKKLKRKWASGFVNSVLRKAADQGKSIPWPDREHEPIAFLSVYYSFPQWLIARWIDQMGLEATEQLCISTNVIPNVTLRTNTLKVSRQRLIDSIRNDVKAANKTSLSPEGISFSSLRIPLPQWATFKKGWFQVQSEASQCIAHLLSVRPGYRVWDTCAGLGTKTAHIAQLMENKGYILATDISRNKLNQLDTEMQRLGINIVESTQLDLTLQPPSLRHHQFDRILVDAPCTGLGVLQKNPDGKWRTDPSAIQKNRRRQLSLLERIAPYLSGGGLMVYTVCSIEPDENECIIEGFLQKHPEFVIDNSKIKLNRIKNGEKLLTPKGFFKTFPHKHHMDGFFAAILKKGTPTTTRLPGGLD